MAKCVIPPGFVYHKVTLIIVAQQSNHEVGLWKQSLSVNIEFSFADRMQPGKGEQSNVIIMVCFISSTSDLSNAGLFRARDFAAMVSHFIETETDVSQVLIRLHSNLYLLLGFIFCPSLVDSYEDIHTERPAGWHAE